MVGVEWHLLHVLDHSNYWQSVRHDYIILPAGARTAATRLRWWQRLQDATTNTVTHLGWSLDNVHVGGMDIAPSSFQETFEQLDESRWEFHPGGTLQHGVCDSSTGSVMSWNSGRASSLNMITTCQMIVQQNYMMQFKVTFLVSVNSCFIIHFCGQSMPYLSTLEVCLQWGTTQIHVYLYLYLYTQC